MWPGMWKIFFLAILVSTAVKDSATPEIGAGTILVYETQAGDLSGQFVIRIARFKPDIVLEWESRNHQGVVHLYRGAVENATQFSLDKLFEAGVEMESSDRMVKWLPRRRYLELVDHNHVKFKFGHQSLKLNLRGRSTRVMVVNGEEMVVDVIEAMDEMGTRWAFLKDPDNPLMVEYRSRYYQESLTRVSNGSIKSLRWIRKLPPIK